MKVQQDFKELLESFNARKVDYVIVGAYALAFHGAPRYTGDMNILVKPDGDNARRILDALEDFGFGDLELSSDDLTQPGRLIQLGVAPVRIDIATSITGLNWERVAANRVSGDYGEVPVYFISKEDFIANKKALGRHRDLADIEALGEEAE
ncbi:MAG: hypothetical protein JSU85_06160 [Candidatus Zixiibacteriota bacterium]|nr:MAG: hypothetical protein JSU85_06160 [candidate division Zixibacteria bacterium]